MLSPTFSGNAATKHGHKYEPVAREQFSKKTGLSVTRCGTVVHATVPWLSASPDGVLQAADALLEVKCPYVMDVVNLIRAGKYDVKEDGDKYILPRNGPNGYYGQVQFQMYCTGHKLCYFYVWSVKSDALVTVPFESSFVVAQVPRLQKFYFCELLPEMEKQHAQGKLSLCKEYVKLCEL